MKFFPQSRSARIRTGFSFDYTLPLQNYLGAYVTDESELSLWTYRAILKRSPSHDLNDEETMIPTVTRTGGDLDITLDPIQTEGLRGGRMMMLVYAEQGNDRQLIANIMIYVEYEGEF